MNNVISICDKQLTLTFDTAAWVDLEAVFGSIERMYKRLDDDVLPLTTGLHLAAICATSGTCDRDKKEKIEFSWLVKHATPAQARELGHIARMAVIKGMESTESLFEEDGPIDVGLEEEAAKKNTGGRMTARKLIGYGLIAGLSLREIMASPPGAVLDWFIMRTKYDDIQHGIKRKNPYAWGEE